jgi:hypothetical protein
VLPTRQNTLIACRIAASCAPRDFCALRNIIPHSNGKCCCPGAAAFTLFLSFSAIGIIMAHFFAASPQKNRARKTRVQARAVFRGLTARRKQTLLLLKSGGLPLGSPCRRLSAAIALPPLFRQAGLIPKTRSLTSRESLWGGC